MEQLKYILVVGTLIFAVPSSAQYCGYQYPDSALFRAPTYVGFSAGVISNSLSGSEIDFRQRSGGRITPVKALIISGVVKHEIRPAFYIKYGLEYLERKNREVQSSFVNTYNLSLTYLNVPFKFAYQPLNFTNSDLGIQFGIEAGLAGIFELGNESAKFERGLHPSTTGIATRKNLFSALVGGNLEFQVIPRHVVFINYTYYRDLDTVFTRTYMSKKYDVLASGWNLSGGLMILIGQPKLN